MHDIIVCLTALAIYALTVAAIGIATWIEIRRKEARRQAIGPAAHASAPRPSRPSSAAILHARRAGRRPRLTRPVGM